MTRPSAPRGYEHMKKGRASKRVRPVRSVEAVSCPATLHAEKHELTNDSRGRTACLWCGEPWAALDAIERNRP